MTLEEGLVAHLRADGTITALVGTAPARIFRAILPQNVQYPAISFQPLSDERFNTLDGPNSMVKRRVQIDCWDDDVAGIEALSDVVRISLNGLQGDLGGFTIQHAWVDNRNSFDEVDGDRIDRRISYDFIFSYNEV